MRIFKYLVQRWSHHSLVGDIRNNSHPSICSFECNIESLHQLTLRSLQISSTAGAPEYFAIVLNPMQREWDELIDEKQSETECVIKMIQMQKEQEQIETRSIPQYPT